MPAAILPGRYDDFGPVLPFSDQLRDYARGNRRVIDKGYKHAPRIVIYYTNAGCNRCAHFAGRIRVDCDRRVVDAITDFIRTVAEYYYDLVHATFAQVIETALDHCLLAKRKQRLERSHAA